MTATLARGDSWGQLDEALQRCFDDALRDAIVKRRPDPWQTASDEIAGHVGGFLEAMDEAAKS